MGRQAIDDEDDDDTGTDAADIADPDDNDEEEASASQSGGSNDDQRQAIEQYLRDKYAPQGSETPPQPPPSLLQQSQNLDQIKAARQNMQDVGQRAQIGNALANMFNPGGAEGNAQFFGNMRGDAARDLQNAEGNREDLIKNYMLQQKQATDTHARSLMDPNSPESMAIKNAYIRMFPKMFQKPVLGADGKPMMDAQGNPMTELDTHALDPLGGGDVQAQLSKPMELKSKADEMLEAAKLRGTIAAEGSRNRKAQQDINDQLRYDAADAKSAQAKNKAYADLVDKVQGSRTPQDVQQARAASKAIKSAQDLINQYPDLDTMPKEQVQLLNSEISKVAQGGVPTEGEMKGMDPHTVQSRWQGFLASVEGKPTGAQLRGFIQQNQRYLAGLKNVNDNIVNDFVRKEYHGRRNQMDPMDQEEFMRDYSDAFQDQQGIAGNSQPPTPPPARNNPQGPTLEELIAEKTRRTQQPQMSTAKRQ